MLHHDRLTLWPETAGATEVRATVTPLRTSETIKYGGTDVQADYRVFLGPRVDPDGPGSMDWRGRRFQLIGAWETWTKRGRVHHYECVMRRITGGT